MKGKNNILIKDKLNYIEKNRMVLKCMILKVLFYFKYLICNVLLVGVIIIGDLEIFLLIVFVC